VSTLSQFFSSGETSSSHAAYMEEGWNLAIADPRFEWQNGTNTGGAATQMCVQSRDTTSTINAFAGSCVSGGVLYLSGAKKIRVTGSGYWSPGGSVDVYLEQVEEINQFGFSMYAGGTLILGTSVANRLLKTIGTLYHFQGGTSANMEYLQNFTQLANINKFVFQKTSTSGNTNMTMSGCAFTAASVENILVGIDQGSPTRSGGTWTCNLSGGTSAGLGSLSSAALAARTSLIAKGWTVTLNP
jgi:hypothetical protein